MANAVNNSDWVVGRAGVYHSVQPRTTGNAWLWRPDDAPTPLYALAPTGWTMANANDINDDGMIVGSGRHGGKDMGFWMAPASIAHKLSGTVYGPTGVPVAGAQLRITNAAGNELAAPVTGAGGTYSTTLNRGGPYDITVLPDGRYRPDGLAGCTAVGSACRLNLSKNRTVDFYDTTVEVPNSTGGGPAANAGGGSPAGGGGAAPAGGGPARASGGASSGGGGTPGTGTPRGPVFSFSSKSKTVQASVKGAVTVKLGRFSTAATGTMTLQTAVKASAKRKARRLGKAKFKARARKALTVKVRLGKKSRAYLKKQRRVRAVAIISAKTAAGGVTVRRYTLTVKAPRRSS